MRVLVQRVSEAKVTIKRKVVGEIKKGLFVLVGVRKGDTLKDAESLAEKLSKLRVMADKSGKMNLSVLDSKSEVLAVSQFTLHADTSQGNRPSFIAAAVPELADELYEHFVKSLRGKGIKVETGKFGAYMRIDSKLDGPVTIFLEETSD
jgi:D-tyrosyl-tRNA(Tyr) deacylase